MNVYELRCGQELPETPFVLSILPLVRWSLHPVAGNSAHLKKPHQGPQKKCFSDLDGTWPPRVPVTANGSVWDLLGPSSVRARDTDESPLSQSEAVIAMRDFPIKVQP